MEGQSIEKRLSLFLPLLCACLSLYDSHAPGDIETDTAKPDSEDEHSAAVHSSNSEQTGIENGVMENEESEMDTEHPPANESPSDSADLPSEGEERLHHLLFSSLSTLRKIATECSLLRNPVHCETMNKIWGESVT